MSRSFGDLRLKYPVPFVISDPEFHIEELTPIDQFIILASDGLWDVLTDQRAVDIVRKCENSQVFFLFILTNRILILF
jgi:serine/threonine protein phosphatase PrpC